MISSPLLLGDEGGYQISRSLRFRSNASAYLNRTPASAGNRRTFTWSGWVKRGGLGTRQTLLNAYSGDENNTTEFGFDTSNKFFFSNVISSTQGNGFYGVTTPVFRDASAWYHIVFSVDTTQTTGAAALKLYINNVQQTLTTSYGGGTNHNTFINAVLPHRLGQTAPPNSSYFNGYLAEVNFIDGQALTPSSFGETDIITGVWKPKKYASTYGTNGFYLNFSDNSAVTTSSNVGIGKDFSGNGNYWTSNAISVTAGTTYDSMLDVPTSYSDGNSGRGNYCTLNPLAKPPQFPLLTEGNLRTGDTNVGNFHQTVGSTLAVSSDKWYWEIALNGTTYNSRSLGIAFASQLAYAAATNQNGMWNTTSDLKDYRAILIGNSTTVTPCRSIAGTVTTATNITLPSTLTSTSVFMVAMDITTGAIWFGLNGTWLKGATTAEIIAGTTTNAVYTDIGSPSDFWTPAVYNYLGNSVGYGFIANFGQRPFSYTPPTGFKALNTQNLPDVTIKKGSEHFDAIASTATVSTGTTVSSLSFSPGLMWRKNRNNVEQHYLVDAIRGTGSGGFLSSNATAAATGYPNSDGTLTFNSNGYTITDSNWNAGEFYFNNRTYVDWIWNAGNSTVTNTSGSISAQVRANTTAGFSVVTYTGTGANATVGHGLGVAPSFIIVKSRSTGATNWTCYHASLGATKAQLLNTTQAVITSGTYWNSTAPTSSVISIGTDGSVNTNASTFVAYCFAQVAGYSKIGSYTGNGNADGPFVYCGFRPKFVLIKSTTAARDWLIYDSVRGTYNILAEGPLQPNTTNTPYGAGYLGLDILSNGFKVRESTTNMNASNEIHIFIAFAENPFKNSLAR